jgi:hypothetical protein
MCYYCTGSVLEYREKKSLAEYEASMVEYHLTKDEQYEESKKAICCGGIRQMQSMQG